jgi:sulfate adenylyltransferase subunit 2
LKKSSFQKSNFEEILLLKNPIFEKSNNRKIKTPKSNPSKIRKSNNPKSINPKYPNIEIVKIPHWNLSYIYRTGTYCAESKETKLITLKDCIDWANKQFNNSTIFLGMKKSDSLNRNLMLRNLPNYYVEKTNVCYPIASWGNTEVQSYIKLKKLATPIKYSNSKKSQGLGFNEEVFVFLRNNYPSDLLKIYNKFPLAEQILFEYDRKNKISNI